MTLEVGESVREWSPPGKLELTTSSNLGSHERPYHPLSGDSIIMSLRDAAGRLLQKYRWKRIT